MMRADEALERVRSANPLPDVEHVDTDEIALFLSHFEERRSSMTMTDTRGTSFEPLPGPRRNWRPVLVIGLAMMLVLALVGGVVLVIGGGEEPEVTLPPATDGVATTQVPPTTGEPATRVSPVAPPLVLELSWTRTDFAPGEAHPGVGVHGDPGWVAFQLEPSTPGFMGASHPLFSIDGVTWQELVADPIVFPEGVCVSDPVHADGRYLALLEACSGESFTGGRVATSADGRTWTRLPGDVGGSIAYGAPGFVALNGNWDEEAEDWISVQLSPDAEQWTELPHDEATFGSAGWIDVRGIVFGDAGYVAFGADDLGGDGQIGVVWHSSDGLAWTRVPNTDDIFGGPAGPSTWIETESLAYTNGTYVLVGGGGATPSIWVSTDGLAWTLLPNADGVFGTADETLGMYEVAGGDEGFVVIGAAYEERPVFEGSDQLSWHPVAPAAWTSPDGLSWTRVAGDEDLFGGEGDVSFDQIAYGDGRFVISGVERVADLDDPGMFVEHRIVWVAE